MQKICHILPGAGYGGMETQVRLLCDALARRYDVTVVVPRHARGEFGPAVHVVRSWALSFSRHNPLGLLGMALLLRRLRPDIIHVHGSKPIWWLSHRWLFPRVPLVATVHGIKNSAIHGLRSMSCVVAISKAVAMMVRHQAPRLAIIPNGIPVSADPVRPVRAVGGPRRLLAVGRLVPVKGFDVLIRAMVFVPDAELEIVGDGESRKDLEALVRELGLSDRVRLVGYRTDVAKRIDASELVVIPSRREGMSLVLVEALQRRRPLVVTACGGVIDYVPEAVVVPTENPAALAEKIMWALSPAANLDGLYAPYWDNARRNLTAENMAARVEEVYRTARTVPVRDSLVPWALTGLVLFVWIALAVGFYPVIMSDTVVRYGPMAEAFARGDWAEAFHPRFGVLFQCLSGSVAWLTGLDGVRSCQVAALFLLSLGCAPLYRLLRRMFDDRAVAVWGVLLYAVSPELVGYAMDGLRDPGRATGLLFYAAGLLSLLRGGKGFSAAVGCFLLGGIRGDTFVIALAGLAAFALFDFLRNHWRLWRSAAVLAGVLFAALPLCVMNHAFTGWWTPALRYVDVFQKLVRSLTGGAT